MSSKKNISLIIGIAIPIFMIFLIAISIYLPSLFAPAPQFNFFYVTEDGYGQNRQFGVENGVLVKYEVKYPEHYTPRAARLFIHDVSRNTDQEVSFEEAQKLKLDKNLKILHDNFEKPEIKKKYDAVFCFGVIHHFDPNKKSLILENIAFSLKNGGSIYLLEPNPFNPLFYLIYFWRWLNNAQGLNRWSTEKGFLKSNIWSLKNTLKKMGISKIKNKWYGYLPSRFANCAPLVLELNKLFNIIFFFRLFSAYIWIKGKKL